MAFSCLSREVCDNVMREGGDEFSSVCSFMPAKLVKSLKFLALCPRGGDDKLEIAIARAQLLAFNRWKGISELPEFINLGGLDGDFAEARVSKEKTDSEGDTEDESWVPEGNKIISLRKLKPNSKYVEDDKDDDDFDIATEETSNVAEGTKRISSRKRKINSKYREGEGTTQSWLMEEDLNDSNVLEEATEFDDISEVVKENKKPLSRKRKARLERVSSRNRKPNAKYSEDEGEAQTGLLMENVGLFEGVDEGKEQSSEKTTTEFSEDEGKNNIEEDYVDAYGSKEINNLEGKKGVSLRKRNPNVKYKEKVEKEEEDFDSPLSEEREDSEGVTQAAVWAPEGNKRASSRKRKPNAKYSDDGDYCYDAMGEHEYETFQNFQASYEKSQRKKLILPEYPSPDGILSQLHIAARDPTKGYTLLTSLFGFFADYRNSLPEVSERPFDTIMGTDFEPEIIERETNGAGYTDDKTNKDYTPTAVILFFVDVDSVPSKTDLHHVFSCYGSLNKAKTEVVKRLRRARVVFKRRLDAENALKGTGRFSIFGPSLVSYRISYFYPE